MRGLDRHLDGGGLGARSGLPQMVAHAAELLPELDEPEFARLFDRFGDARVVLLGASSDGAAEFIRARAAITRWLIERRGFTVVALDADWLDARAMDAWVRGRKLPAHAAAAFDRFPAWVWRNREFDAFLSWLKAHNAARGDAPKAGVYGLDLYGRSAAMRAAIDDLDRADPGAAEMARRRFGGLTPWADEPPGYGRLALTANYARHERAVTTLLCDRLTREAKAMADERLLDAAQAARLVREAAAHYRALYYGGPEGWNVRNRHLFETLDGLLAVKGPDAKAVVWAHNAHVGDARASDMGAIREELSLGQLCREAWGREAALVGFGAHGGTIACAREWDAPMEVRPVNPALAESWEAVGRDTRIPRFLLDLRPGRNEDLRPHLSEPRLERFIGPVYRPETERWSHHADCRLARQFDGWAWFDETSPVTPIASAAKPSRRGRPENAWPFEL